MTRPATLPAYGAMETKRLFVAALAAGLFITMWGCSELSDEHRADVTGYSGNDVIRTPVRDELARTGVVFRNAYTPSPICIPARQCMMSGQLPKTCGCEGWIDLKPGHMTFSRLFSQYAYETVVCGKLHHDGVDQMQGWTQRPAGDLHVASAHISDRIEEEHARYERLFSHHKWPDT